MRKICLILLLLPLACERREAARSREMAARVFQGVLVYPRAQVQDVSAGANAAQVTFTATAAPQTVAAWYRETLRLNGWQLNSDATTPDGVAIYAEKEKRPLWIQLRATVGAPGTTFTLVGAEIAGDTIR